MSNLIKLSSTSQRRDKTSSHVTMIILRNFSECAEPKKKCTPEKKRKMQEKNNKELEDLKTTHAND